MKMVQVKKAYTSVQLIVALVALLDVVRTALNDFFCALGLPQGADCDE